MKKSVNFVRKKKWIAGVIGLLCLSLIVGCGSSHQDAQSESSGAEQADGASSDTTIALTIVNASGGYVKEVVFEVPDDENYEVASALSEVDGLDLWEEMEVDIPYSEYEYHIEAYDSEWEPMYQNAFLGTLQDKDTIFLLPEYDENNMIYAVGTDVDQVKESLMEADASAEMNPSETWTDEKPETSLDEAVQKAVEALGYESLDDMRFATHEGFELNRGEFRDLTGYWYPDGDKNSESYLAVDERDNMRWYQFVPESGDEEVSVDGITMKVLNTYTLHDGRKFTVKNDVLKFEDEETEYYKGNY